MNESRRRVSANDEESASVKAMTAIEHDIELCELYLDHELADAEARQLDERLAADASLRVTLERLRGQRTVRLEAMSTAFDTDAASVERLVASVRMAQASEAIRRKRTWWRPNRTAMAAAAAVAFGVTLGGIIQGRQGGHWLAAPGRPAEAQPSPMINGSTVGAEFTGHGAFVVSIRDASGQERFKAHFRSAEEAARYVESIRNGNAVGAADARVVDESY